MISFYRIKAQYGHRVSDLIQHNCTHADTSFAACLDWELMASLGARHRTEREHRAMYEGAGLKLVGIWSHPQSLDSLLELELA
jgi:hypothetical protein